MELSYSILFMQANHFSRADVALPGFAKYFKEASEREWENANEFMNYVNKRGGVLDFKDIPVIILLSSIMNKHPL